MDKRRLHHLWTRLRRVKPWYFLGLTVLSGLICIFALRANNQHMIELRQTVYTADKRGDEVTGPLKALQAYVTSHMNTDLSAGPNAVYPPIQLKYTYERLIASQKSKVAKDNSSIYSDAQHYCERKNPRDFSGRNRVPCIEKYVKSHTPAKPATVPDALYKFAFVSPRWSPDLAGWSLLLTVFSTFLFAASLAARLWLKHSLK
jgi:hypothetical protein